MKQLHKYLLIGLLWFLPLSILWFLINDGRYYIGGDVMIPIDPLENLRKLALWHSGRESLHYLHTFWYLYYYLLELIGIPTHTAQKIFIILLFALSSYFVFKLHQLLFKDSNFGQRYWPYISAFIFLYNPIHFLVVPTYLPLFGFPIVGYIFARYLSRPTIMWGILYAFALNFFFFIDLPQPKMIILFVLFALILTFLVKITNPKLNYQSLFHRLVLLCLTTISLNLWIILPYVYSIFNGEIGGFSGQIASHNGEADLGSAQLLYITRFFNLSITTDFPYLKNFLFSISFTFWSMILLAIAFSPIFYKLPRRLNRIIFTIFIFSIFIFFLAKGANPPFGFLYKFLIIQIPLFRIFRTTASTITVWVVFYSILVSFGLYLLYTYFHFSRKLLILFFFIHLVIFHPFYLGYKYFNSTNNQSAVRGIELPKEYSEIAKALSDLNPDARILALPFSGNYVYKNWGYFGPDIIPWLSGDNFVTTPEYSSLSLQSTAQLTIFQNLFLSGVTHALLPKDNLRQSPHSLTQNNELVFSNAYFDLYQLKLNQPAQFYFAEDITSGHPASVSSNEVETDPFKVFVSAIDNYPDLSTSSGEPKQNEYYPEGFSSPKSIAIQYTTLNPAHYILQFDLQKKESLIFMDFYNKDWMLYSLPRSISNPIHQLSYFFRSSNAKHLIVNGHYNAWELDPQMIGSGQVTMHVVYFPQLLFYVGSFASIVILSSLVLFRFHKFPFRPRHA